MQALTQVAAQLLRENWSIVEDLFRAAAATVHHLKNYIHPCPPPPPPPSNFSPTGVECHSPARRNPACGPAPSLVPPLYVADHSP